MTLKEIVAKYREIHGISQRQLAINCGLSNGYISMLENGRNPKTGLPVMPSLPVLKKLASGMGMTLQDLFLQVDDMPVEILCAESKQPTTEFDGELSEIARIFTALSPDNRSKLLELSRLYLAAQHNKE